MDFVLTDEQRMFAKMFADFCEKEVAPLAEETDHEEKPPLKQLEAASEQGFLGATLPEDYGGAELDALSYILLLEEMGKYCVSTALTLNVHVALTGMTILTNGSEEQKGRYLPSLAAGEMLGAFALSEPSAGSDPASLRMQAVWRDSHYTLKGSKLWVTNAGIGQLIIVFARSIHDGEDRGVSAFLVETDTPGVKIGYREKTMGLRGVTSNAVYFDECRVPADALLGEVGIGLSIAQSALDFSRIGVSAICLGAAEFAVDAGTKYASDRIQFGAPIGTKGAIQNLIADSVTDVEAMRCLTYHAAWLTGEGGHFTEQAAIAKLFCSEAAMRVANRIVQVHGGYGYMKDYPIERIYRDLRAMEIVEGTSQIQRRVIAGKHLAAHGLIV
jgi:butyryl-CoA dehydrogenase